MKWRMNDMSSDLITNADIIVQLGLLSDDKNSLLKENQTFIGVLNPNENKDKIDIMVKKNINILRIILQSIRRLPIMRFL